MKGIADMGWYPLTMDGLTSGNNLFIYRSTDRVVSISMYVSQGVAVESVTICKLLRFSQHLAGMCKRKILVTKHCHFAHPPRTRRKRHEKNIFLVVAGGCSPT